MTIAKTPDMQHALRRHATIAVCFLGALSASTGAAQAPSTPATSPFQVEVRGAALFVGAADSVPRRLALPCEPIVQQQVVDANSIRLYLACAQRVLVLDVATTGVAIMDDVALRSAVRGSHEVSGQTWLELEDGSAQRIDAPSSASALAQPTVTATAAPAAPIPSVPSPAAPIPGVPSPAAPAAASTAVTGRVSQLRPQDRAFVVNLGSADGLTPGMRIAVSSGDHEAADAHVVTGAVRSTTDHSALVSLAYDEQVAVGQRAEIADRVGRTASRRIGEWPYRLSIRGDLRPSLVLDGVGANLALEGEATLHQGIGVVTLRLSSSGVSFAKRTVDASSYDGDTGADFGFGGGYVLGGVDLGFVAVSAGVGVTRLYEEEVGRYVSGTGSWVVVTPAGFTPALTFPLRLRIGREDSIHAEVTQIAGYERSRLRWLGVEARLLVPAGPVWIFGEGAGGRMPAFHGTAGVRVPLSGNGGPGSVLLNVGAGAAGTTEQTEAQTTRVGPAVQVGLERRL